MPFEGADQLAGGRVPQFERLVGAPGEQARAVGRECHREDCGGMSLEAANQLACAGVPKFQRVIPAAGEGARAVGRERHRFDLLGMPAEGAEQPARGGVPKFQRVIPAAGEDARAVWRKRYRLDPSRVRDLRDNLDLEAILGACWRYACANRHEEQTDNQTRPETPILHVCTPTQLTKEAQYVDRGSQYDT